VLLCLAATAHRPLLYALGSGLVVNQDPGAATAAFVASGDGRFQLAAQLVKTNRVEQILIVKPRPRRLVQLGILRPSDEVAIEKLCELGLDRSQIIVLTGDDSGSWRSVRLVSQWLGRRRNAEILVLVDRFESRRYHRLFDGLVSSSTRGKVRFAALRDGRFDESNWWQSRLGWKRLFDAYFSLVYDVTVGEERQFESVWSPDDYERRLIEGWRAGVT
jgi:hypothetical protein